MAEYSHLSNEDRSHIEAGLDNRKLFKEIGEKVGKDCATISKEVRSHMVFRKTGVYGRPFNDCVGRKTCQFSGVCDVCPEGKARTRFCSACGKCTDHCIMYEKENVPGSPNLRMSATAALISGTAHLKNASTMLQQPRRNTLRFCQKPGRGLLSRRRKRNVWMTSSRL